jgi:hypothetical protein
LRCARLSEKPSHRLITQRSSRIDDGARVGLLTEIRYREKVMGTTWSSRQDMRIMYAQPSSSTPASVSTLDDYRDL